MPRSHGLIRASALLALVLVLAPALPAAAQSPSPAPAQARQPFGVTGHEVVAERDVPQACFTFDRRLERVRGIDYLRFVAVEPATRLRAIVRDRSLCLEGLAHGHRYRLTLKAGLPGEAGARLPTASGFDITVPDRPPSLAFRNGGYILPRLDPDGLGLRGINVAQARVQVRRISDPTLIERLYHGRIGQSLPDEEIAKLVKENATVAWEGEVGFPAAPNQAASVPFPPDALSASGAPGLYIVTAENTASQPGAKETGRAEQWLLVSDLGLATLRGEDGLTVFARTLDDARPAGGIDVRLLARNHDELAKASTGADGIARIPAEAFKRIGATAPQILFASAADGKFGLLDVEAAGLDTENQAKASLPRAFVHTDRGLYRPGETAHVTALLRDRSFRAVEGKSPVLRLLRPDGLAVEERKIADSGVGGYVTTLTLPPRAFAGDWTVSLHLDPAEPPVGTTTLRVEDFTPPTLDLSLEADQPLLTAGSSATLSVTARTADGSPAADLPGELSLSLRPAASPFPAHEGFRFGLDQEQPDWRPLPLPGFVTDAAGRAVVKLPPVKLPETSLTIEAVLRVTLADIRGAKTARDLVLPVRRQPFAIGLRPRFEGDAVPEGATAAFEVIAVGSDGQQIARDGLHVELYEEQQENAWFETDGRWDYKPIVHERRLGGGLVNVPAGGSALVEQSVGSGRYRIEVFDPVSGVASSRRFTAGWWVTPVLSERPDAVELKVMPPAAGSGRARVFVRPPYESQVLVAVTDGTVRNATGHRIGPEGAFVEVPVDPVWKGGLSVVATAFAPARANPNLPPQRALGIAPLTVEAPDHRLDVAIELPADMAPGSRVTIPVRVRDAKGKAQVMLTAVDETLLGLTGFRSPDPVTGLLDGPTAAIEVRDSRGRLIAPTRDPHDPHGPASPPSAPLAADGVQAVSTQAGPVTVDPDGVARITLDLPETAGRIRLTAVAWTADRLGHADKVAEFRDLPRAELHLPPFLRIGDEARPEAVIRLAEAGDWNLTATSGGPALSVEGTGEGRAEPQGRSTRVPLSLTARQPGTGILDVALTTGTSDTVAFRRRMTVLETGPSDIHTRSQLVAPAASADFSDKDIAPAPEPAANLLAVGPLPDLGTAAILPLLLATPADGTADLAGTAIALLRNAEPLTGSGLADAVSVQAVTQGHLDRLLTLQRADGSFGMWSPDGHTDVRTSATAVEALGWARERGHRIPDPAWGKALEWLSRSLEEGETGASAQLAARAHAYYVLARAKAVDVAELQYFSDTWSNHLPDALSRAHLGAALALLGDRDRAMVLHDVAEAELTSRSRLQDAAATLAMLADSGLVPADRLAALTELVSTRLQEAGGPRRMPHLDRSWLAVAAAAVAPAGGRFTVAIDGVELTAERTLYRQAGAGHRFAVTNRSGRPLNVALGLIRPIPDAGEADGFRLDRKLLDSRGRPVDPMAIRTGQRLVVLLEGEAPADSREVVLAAPLPAGVQLETPHPGSALTGDLAWLGPLSVPSALDVRDGRYHAVLSLPGGERRFRLAYLVRATVPGRFAIPPAMVSAPATPGPFARTSGERLHITAPK